MLLIHITLYYILMLKLRKIVPCVLVVLCACYGEICDWLNDWDICCWWEYMILGWKGERWTCDAWFAYVNKSDSCSYESGSWFDRLELMWWLFDLIVHCGVSMFDEQCVLVMQHICAFDWMLEVYVVDGKCWNV